MKKGKEVRLVSPTNFNITIGTVDNKNPKTIFINITGWGEPTTDAELNYEGIINRLNKRVRQYLNNVLEDELFYKNRIITDLDMKSSGVRKDKRSFMALEITIFQKEMHQVNKAPLKGILYDISHNIINNVLEPNEYFDFHKTKSDNKRELV